MESAAQTSAGGARRTARKSTAALQPTRVVMDTQDVTTTPKVSTETINDDSSPTTSARRYVSRQRTSVRMSDFVYDFEPEAFAEAQDGSPRRKRGRPRKNELQVPQMSQMSQVPRKRGRPRKYLFDGAHDEDAHNQVQVFSHDEAAQLETDDNDAGADEQSNPIAEQTETDDEAMKPGVEGIARAGRPAAEAWNQVMICSEEKAVALCRAADWVFHDQRTNASGTRIMQYNCRFMKKTRWTSCRAKLKLLVHGADRAEMWRLGSHMHIPLADASESGAPRGDESKMSEPDATFTFTDDSEHADGAASAKRRARIDERTQAFIDAYVKVKPFAKPSAVLSAIEQRGLPVPTLKQLYNRLSKQNRPRVAGTGRRSRESASSDAEIDELSAELRKYEREHTVTKEQDTLDAIQATPAKMNSCKSVVVVYPRSAPAAPPVLPSQPVTDVKEFPATLAKQEDSQTQTQLSRPPGRKSTPNAVGASRWSNQFESPAEAILKWATAHSRQLETVLKRMRNDSPEDVEGETPKIRMKTETDDSVRRDATLIGLQLHTPVVVRSSDPSQSAVTGVNWCMLISTVAMLKLAALHKQLLQIDTSVCGVWQQRVRVAMLGTSDSTQQFRCVCLVVYELLPGADEVDANQSQAGAAGNVVQSAGLSQTTLEFVLRSLKDAVELVNRSIRVQTQATADDPMPGEAELEADTSANALYQPAAVVCNYDEAIIRAVRTVFGGDGTDGDASGTDGPRIAICAKQVERDLKAHCPSAAWLTAPFVQKNLKVLAGALNEAQFLRGAELFYNDFADSHGLGSELHKFCVYLKRYWVDDPLRRTWYAGYLPPVTAKRNDGLHDRIGLFREKYRLLFANDAGRFVSWLCRATQDWSDSDWHAATAADLNRHAHVYALEDFLAARTWSNERFKFIHISVEAGTGPAGATNGAQQQEVWLIADGTCSKYRKFFDDPTHSAELLYALATDYNDLTTWKEYRLRRLQLLLVTKRADTSYHCTCIDYLQTALCKHSLGMAIRNGELIVPDDLDVPVSEAQANPVPPPSRPAAPAATSAGMVKRKPGRPRLTPLPGSTCAGVAQGTQNGSAGMAAQNAATAASVADSDLGLLGASESTLEASNLVYYGDQADAEVEMNDSQLAL